MTDAEFLESITCPNCGHVRATDADGRCVNCGHDEDAGKEPVALPPDPTLEDWAAEIEAQQHGAIFAWKIG